MRTRWKRDSPWHALKLYRRYVENSYSFRHDANLYAQHPARLISIVLLTSHRVGTIGPRQIHECQNLLNTQSCNPIDSASCPFACNITLPTIQRNRQIPKWLKLWEDALPRRIRLHFITKSITDNNKISRTMCRFEPPPLVLGNP